MLLQNRDNLGHDGWEVSLVHVAVVIPCFKAGSEILSVIGGIGSEVSTIIVVDDACPEKSGQLVVDTCSDPRVSVSFHRENQGVGGALKTGYEIALASGADVVVKLDADGQMDPQLIGLFLAPILEGRADYSKGNRFETLENLAEMPKIRLLGNAFLSLCSKISTGYWKLNDPTNGYTAISSDALRLIGFSKVDSGYFFESDMLFRLALARCLVEDVSMPARYRGEHSSLNIPKTMFEFPLKHVRNFLKRIFYQYYLREWSIASFELPLSILLVVVGMSIGISGFISGLNSGLGITPGQATVSSLSLLLGVQFLLGFLSFDLNSSPRIPKTVRFRKSSDDQNS